MNPSNQKLKIGLFGGSFNPIHEGHVQSAKELLKNLNLNNIIFIPALISPHKLDQEIVSKKHRLKMVELALKEYPYFSTSSFELENEKISFSVNTVKYYRSLYPSAQLYFLLGSDVISSLDKWYKIDEIFNLCQIIIYDRAGYENNQELILYSSFSKKYKQNLMENYIRMSVPKISSTQLRRAIKEKKSVEKFIPKDVYRYIIENLVYT